MKAIIVAITLVTATSAVAQNFSPDAILTPGTALPRTIKIVGPDGQLLATATIGAFVVTFRDANGELLGSSGIDRKTGVRTYYDPNGKVLYTVKNGVLFDASGQEAPKSTVNPFRAIEQLDK